MQKETFKYGLKYLNTGCELIWITMHTARWDLTQVRVLYTYVKGCTSDQHHGTEREGVQLCVLDGFARPCVRG